MTSKFLWAPYKSNGFKRGLSSFTHVARHPAELLWREGGLLRVKSTIRGRLSIINLCVDARRARRLAHG